MPRSRTVNDETITFRLSPSLKATLARIAERERKSLGQLIRELVKEKITLEQRREFEEEARRQSREASIAAEDPESDEARVMRELEAELREFTDEWS